jgi:phosphate acetyltransferase
MDPISQNIYITGAEQGSGKSIIMLAMMEMFSGHAHKVGFFRPIIHAGEEKDALIKLVTYRYQLDWPYESMFGCTDDEAHRLLSIDRYDDLLKTILAKYRSLKIQCDHVVCVGSDYKSGDSIFEFDFNADVANNLGCLLMPVIQGTGRDNTQITDVYMKTTPTCWPPSLTVYSQLKWMSSEPVSIMTRIPVFPSTSYHPNPH